MTNTSRKIKFLALIIAVFSILARNSSARADANNSSTQNSQTPQDQDSSNPNSPDDVNISYSGDNQSDSTSHVGGDVYFGQNFHFGIFGETSKAKPTSGSGSSTPQKSSNTFDVTLGSDQDRPFSAAVEFTNFGLKDALIENTLRLPFGFNSDDWSGSLTPGHGTINFSSKSARSRTVDVQIGDNSIAGSISYLGFNNWRLGAQAEYHSFTQDLTKLDTTVASYLISNNTITLASEINRYSDGVSATYEFKKLDLGLQLGQSQSALDLSISKSATVNTEVYWTDNFSTPISVDVSSTNGTDPTTGKAYPETTTFTAGLTYLFD